MPRWLSVELPLLAAGADANERRERSRRAESASRTGRHTGISRPAEAGHYTDTYFLGERIILS
jgi:hypothetical protein